MSEHDDLERVLMAASERQLEALERELDRKLGYLWRVHADFSPSPFPARGGELPFPLGKGLGVRSAKVKIALALAGLAAVFVGAWLYDLTQGTQSVAGLVVLDKRFERPRLVFKGPGDPVAVTWQLVEPGPNTGVFRYDESPVTGVMSDGNWFRIEGSEIVKQSPTGEESVIVSGLDRPSSLALDPEGNLLVVEGGTGRILRVEAREGELKPGNPVSVLAVAQSPREERSMEKLEETLKLSFELEDLAVGPVYLTVNERGEIFVGERASDGEAVVYKIVQKGFQWWKFYCLYRC